MYHKKTLAIIIILAFSIGLWSTSFARTIQTHLVLSSQDSLWIDKLENAIKSHYRQSEKNDTLWIYLKPGSYLIDRSIIIQNKGQVDCPPIVIKGLGQVTFSGGLTLDNNLLQPLSPIDQKRILSKQARNKILKYNLGKISEYNLGQLACIGFARKSRPVPSILFCDEKRMTLARYPNKDKHEDLKKRNTVIPITKIIDSGSRKVICPVDDANKQNLSHGIFECINPRMENWRNIENIWIDGIFTRDWSWSFNKVKDIDISNKRITLEYPEKYDLTATASFFFICNLLEELDASDEYYIDRKKNIIYFYPTDNFDKAHSKLELSLMSSTFFTLKNIQNFVFQNVNFEMGRSGAIVLDNCENVIIRHCALRNFGVTAITVKGKQNLIEDCHINSIGGTAILLDGGSSETLEAGNNIVRRCDISDWAFYDRVYNPAIKLLGVGNKVIENHLYNSPHAAITLSGNNHLIEGNEIHHILLEFTDFGAIYAFIGAHQEMRGQIITNNYFHDIGLVGDRVNAIYVDECSADWLINGNLFYNIGSEGKRVSAIQSNTGYHIHIDNNVFIDCSQTFELSYHFTTWGSHRYTGYFKPVWDKKIMDIQKIPQIYLETYPSLKDFIKEDKIWTSTCSFTNNVIGNIGFPLKHQGKFYVTLSSDVTHSDSLVTSAGNRFLSFE